MMLSLIVAAYGEGDAQIGSSSSSATRIGSAGITVPVNSSGRIASGTMRIERFEVRDSQIVAVGEMLDAGDAQMSRASSQSSGSATMANSTGSETAAISGSASSGSAMMTTRDITSTYSTLANGAGVNSLTPNSAGYATDPSSVDRPYFPDGNSVSSSSSGTGSAAVVSMPVEITGASCEALHLNLGSAHSSATGSVASTPVAVTITSASVATMGGSNNLCQISGAFGGKASASTMVGHLNRLIGASPASMR